jgi:hypothetical protein
MSACGPTSAPRNHELELAKQREADARAAEQAAAHAAEQARAVEQERLAALAARHAEQESAACSRESAWCGSQTIAEQHRGSPRPEHPDALGCPGHLAPAEPPLEPGEAHPPTTMRSAALDVAATEAARAGGAADRCCYALTAACD